MRNAPYELIGPPQIIWYSGERLWRDRIGTTAFREITTEEYQAAERDKQLRRGVACQNFVLLILDQELWLTPEQLPQWRELVRTTFESLPAGMREEFAPQALLIALVTTFPSPPVADLRPEQAAQWQMFSSYLDQKLSKAEFP